MIYTSRYSNPELRTGKYLAVRISLGTPRWPLGYSLDFEMPDLMPFGLLNKYDTQEEFEPAYFARLNQKGTEKIKFEFEHLGRGGKDIVLLCYEDIRKPDNWCHRRSFAKWWEMKTGQAIPELFDPTPDPSPARQVFSKPVLNVNPIIPPAEQMSLF